MSLLLTLLGLALIVLVLWDVTQTLFFSSVPGVLSQRVAGTIWRGCQRLSRRHPARLAAAGPLAVATIAVCWLTGLILGWALMIWAYLPSGFLLADGVDPADHRGFLDAVYLSIVVLSTLGFGEITPQSGWLRIVVPIEALLGIALVTALIAKILPVQSAVAGFRRFAREVTVLRQVRQEMDLPLAGTGGGFAHALRDLTSDVVAVRNDLAEIRVAYYFRPADDGYALDLALLSLFELAREASEDQDPDLRFSGVLVLKALDGLMREIGPIWLDQDPDATTEDLLVAYAADHLHAPTTDGLP